MTRLLSGVVLAAAALAAIWFLPLLGLRVLAAGVAIVAAHEYVGIAGVRGGSLPVLALTALVCWLVPTPGNGGILILLLPLAWLAIDVLWRGLAIGDAAARFVAPWYVGAPLGMLVAVQGAGGARATLMLLVTVVVSDSAQYYTGRAFGRRPLAPAISPKKTIEGAIGGVLFGTLFMMLAGGYVIGGAPVSRALLGLSIVALGICGDLFESRLKRASGIKDSSTLIPGHGGVLDRIDALLFAAPAFYLYLVRTS
jgi:phosphatidate cytidylyltransferase